MADSGEANKELKFEQLDFRHRALFPVNPNHYRVMALSGEVTEIQANTAYEAFRQSGLTEAIKIERIFIYRRNVIPQKDFSDNEKFSPTHEIEDIFANSPGNETDPLAHFRRRKNPIISAIELDALMRALHAMGNEESPGGIAGIEDSKIAMANHVVAEPASMVPDDHNERVSVPVTLEVPIETAGAEAGLTGMEVHGDGFDEIIPVPVAAKPASSFKAVEPALQPAQAAGQSVSDSIPDQELSSQEIQDLLNGK